MKQLFKIKAREVNSLAFSIIFIVFNCRLIVNSLK
nr:MAG TPA: hypothetical protein [Caudoviricetes sp.]